MTLVLKRRYIALAAVCGCLLTAFAITLAMTGHGPASADAGPSPFTTSASSILHLATTVATEMGDPVPDHIAYLLSTHKAAELATSGATVPDDFPVVVIAMSGHFQATEAQVPPGGPFPSGSELVLTINVATGEVTDFGVSDATPNLGPLGQLEVLK